MKSYNLIGAKYNLVGYSGDFTNTVSITDHTPALHAGAWLLLNAIRTIMLHHLHTMYMSRLCCQGIM